MQETSRYLTGLDIGTHSVRCVVGHVQGDSLTPTIIGIGEAPNNGGLRKGTVVNLNATAQAVDEALAQVERMSGQQINAGIISINGTHITSQLSRGRVSVGQNGEINENDMFRVEDDAAAVVNVSANNEILDIIPSRYQVDGHENVKDPRGMKGLRLEVDANVVTALTPNVQNLHKALEIAHVGVSRVVPAGLAAARASLSEQQRENGVVLVDIGASTTNVVVYDEGELQHVAVLPVGGINITNDLALGLRTDFDIAEKLKLEYSVASPHLRTDHSERLGVKIDKQTHSFEASEVDEIVEARLEEIFELVNKELKHIGKNGRLPGGAVLAGGTSNLKHIVEYAKEALQLPARLSRPADNRGAIEQANKPEFTAAIGLMLLDIGSGEPPRGKNGSHNIDKVTHKAGGMISGLFKKFRS